MHATGTVGIGLYIKHALSKCFCALSFWALQAIVKGRPLDGVAGIDVLFLRLIAFSSGLGKQYVYVRSQVLEGTW